MNLILMTEDLSKNSTGRTYCLWQLARHLGWEARVLSLHGDSLWGPLRDSVFSEHCIRLDEASLVGEARKIRPDVVVGVKPHPWSLGAAAAVATELKVPLVADLDDPDLEGKLSWRRPLHRAARSVLRHKQTTEYKGMRRLVTSIPRSVSNPVLQDLYGGVLIPHVRSGASLITNQTTNTMKDALEVCFVGTPGSHKGVHVLRSAVARLHREGFVLTITDEPPSDAKPWESWVGQTTLEAGLEIVARSSVVAVPSLRRVATHGQFPVKLLDAMFQGKAIVTTNVEPIPWVVGSGAEVIRPGSVTDMVSALRKLRSETVRAQLGARARRRAVEMFSVDQVAPAFGQMIEMHADA